MSKENVFNLSMLLVRLLTGGIFLAHGSQKLFGMFNGIGLDGTAKIAEGLGFPNPFIVAGVWGGIEFVGGMFLLLGILVKLSSAALILTMLIRMWKINLVYGFFIHDGGIEYNLLVITACIPLLLMGGGAWSVWDT